MHVLKVGLEVAGSVVIAYVAIRIIATLVDIGQRAVRRMRGDKEAWKVYGEE